jgi:hypothetical protein
VSKNYQAPLGTNEQQKPDESVEELSEYWSYMLAGNSQTSYHFDPVGVYAFATMMGDQEDPRFINSSKTWTVITCEDVAKLYHSNVPFFQNIEPFTKMGNWQQTVEEGRRQALESDVVITVWTTTQYCGKMVVLSPLCLHGVEYVSSMPGDVL